MKKDEIIKLAKNRDMICLDNLPNFINKKNDKYTFIDKNGYKYSLSGGNLSDKRCKNSIVKAQNPYSMYNIQQFIYNNGGNAKVLSKEWNRANDKITLRCEKCRRAYKTVWYLIYSLHKFKCNKCSYENPYNKKSFDESNKICKKHGYNIIDGKYNNRKDFDIIDKNGYKYSKANIYTLDKRTNKFNRFSSLNDYQLENMKLYVKLQNLPIKFGINPTKDMKKDYYMNIYCIDCGKIFKATWQQITAKHKDCSPRWRCEHCSKKKSVLKTI